MLVDFVRPKPCPIVSAHAVASADRLRYSLVDPWPGVLIVSLSTCIVAGQRIILVANVGRSDFILLSGLSKL